MKHTEVSHSIHRITSLRISIPIKKIQLNQKMFRKSIKSCLPDRWSIVENTSNTVLCYLQQNTTDPQILFTVTIYQNFQYHMKAFNHQYINLPKQFITDNATALTDLLTYITSLKVCPGNPDAKFLELAEQKGGAFTDMHGEANKNFFFGI